MKWHLISSRFISLMWKLEGQGWISISTDLYREPTNANSFLTCDNFPPLHLKKNFPYAEMLWLKRNQSDDMDFHRQTKFLQAQLRKRGYSSRIEKQTFIKATNTNRATLLTNQIRNKQIGWLFHWHMLLIRAFETLRRNVGFYNLIFSNVNHIPGFLGL